MSIFEGMDARQIAMCLSAFYEAGKKNTNTVVYILPNRGTPIAVDQEGFCEGIKILRDDYDVFWTPDINPDDLKFKINKRLAKELREHVMNNSYIDTDAVLYRMSLGPGRVVNNNDWIYRRELGLPDNATVADICKCIRELNDEVKCLKENLGVTEHALKAVKQDKQKLNEAVGDISRDRDNIDRLRRHWHSKYEKEHEECVRLSKLHAADKKKMNEQDETIRKLNNDNTTLNYSISALKKRVRNLEDQLKDMLDSVL